MKKEIVDIPRIQTPESPFNHVVRAGSLLFVTSQLSTDLKTGAIIPGTTSEQTARAMENIGFLLAASGASMDDIVKTVVYMKNVGDFDQMNQVYCTYFTKGQEPARVTVQALSPIQGVEVEIEVTATVPD